MSRPWHDKYPLRSLRGDGDDERFEAFFARQPTAMRRRPAPDRDGAEVDRRHRAKQLALARRAARRERRRLAGSALVAQSTGVVREPLRYARQTEKRRQVGQGEQCPSWPVDDKAQRARSRRRRSSHSSAGDHRKNGECPHFLRRNS